MIKKISLSITSLVVYLSVALPAAAQSINPCPKSAGGSFGNICSYDADTLAKVIRNGITILFVVATVASLVFLILGGIKWITSGGDKGKLDESRNWIVAAIVGLFITFASYFIINFVLELFGLPSLRTYTIPTLIQ